MRNASTDGRRIVFQACGDVYLYDPAVGKAQLVKIDLLLSRKAKIAKFVDPMKYLEQFVLVSGSRLAVVSRGGRSPSRRGRGCGVARRQRRSPEV